MVIWLIGMSGSGKSHIGRTLYRIWKQEDPATVLVDGDEIRRLFKDDRGSDPYTVAARRRNAERIREICAWLDRQGINVVCCILSIFEESHEWNRRNLAQYFEVYLKASLAALEARHPTDMYRKAKLGELKNVVGVDIPFAEPAAPDLVIENDFELVNDKQTALKILAAARAKFAV